MSATKHTNNGHAPIEATSHPFIPFRGTSTPTTLEHKLELPYVFADTVARYLLQVLPSVTAERAHWRAAAAEIPNPILREHARASMRKRGNIEGAALFATLAPPTHRRRTVRALVAYQSAYNYLDALSEQPNTDPVANNDQLHQALLTALNPHAEHPDYYARNPQRDDGGFLAALIDACRYTVASLPAFKTVEPPALAAARRTVDFQSLNLNERQGGDDALRRWAADETPAGSGLAWWETAAAAGSSLAVHALIAAAADPRVDFWDVMEIDRAYFPWMGALHSLLDSLVDRDEDQASGQRSLLDYYRTPTERAISLYSLASRARRATELLPKPHAHRVILTAMCSYYLSAPESDTAQAHELTRALTEALGIPLSVATVMFRVRRLAATLTRGTYT